MTRQHASLAAALSAFGLTGLVLFNPLGTGPQRAVRAPGMAVEVPAVEPITAGSAHRLPWCASEDSIAVPCVWEAAKRGNHRGDSFWVGTDGCRTYFAPAAQARYGDKIAPCLDPM